MKLKLIAGSTIYIGLIVGIEEDEYNIKNRRLPIPKGDRTHNLVIFVATIFIHMHTFLQLPYLLFFFASASVLHLLIYKMTSSLHEKVGIEIITFPLLSVSLQKILSNLQSIQVVWRNVFQFVTNSYFPFHKNIIEINLMQCIYCLTSDEVVHSFRKS